MFYNKNSEKCFTTFQCLHDIKNIVKVFTYFYHKMFKMVLYILFT